jgi:hypothetical protein
MSATNGSFLLNHIPVDDVKTEAQCLAILEQFASQGFCSMFREVINGRVVEFRYDTATHTTSYRWLDGAEANAVLNLQDEYGSAPYSYYDFLSIIGDGIGTLLPPEGGVEVEDKVSLHLSGGWDKEFTVTPAPRAIAEIQRLNQELENPQYFPPEEFSSNVRRPSPSLNDYLDFHRGMLQAIETCMKAGVIYILGD